jgi:predicted O-linked N-acetylglucosamine transferase (SPINDLY family)
VSREDVLAAHEQFGALLDRVFPAAPRELPNPRDPTRKIRVAIVSGDLRAHSCAYFIESFLRLHDRDAIDLYCYHTANADQVTQRLRPLAHAWRECAGVSDTALAQAIRADSIDVAIDLSAHTCAATLLAFHSRVAPVQITYLAYPNTTGVHAMDYRLVDAHTDPEGSEPWCRETLLRLDPCFLCYTPPLHAPGVVAPPSQAPRPNSPQGDGVLRFGSFNAAAKLSPDALQLWSRVLQAVPNSRLVLKASSFIDPLLRGEVRDRLVSWGAPADRLDILAPALETKDHLSLYSTIDIALDPFPYHGTTTTLEALHMGVPVVTLAGDRHAARVGVSLLHAAGLQEFIAATPEQYVDIAATLARDRGRLAALRSTLRQHLATSPISDAAAHTRRLERSILAAWRDHCLRK